MLGLAMAETTLSPMNPQGVLSSVLPSGAEQWGHHRGGSWRPCLASHFRQKGLGPRPSHAPGRGPSGLTQGPASLHVHPPTLSLAQMSYFLTLSHPPSPPSSVHLLLTGGRHGSPAVLRGIGAASQLAG